MKLQRDYQTISGLNAEILAISVDDLSGASYVVENLGLDFPILYNHEKDVVEAYGVYNSSTGYANPSVFIIDTEARYGGGSLAPPITAPAIATSLPNWKS